MNDKPGRLKQELFDFDLHAIDGGLQLRGFIGGDRASDHGAGNSARASESYFAVGGKEVEKKKTNG